MLGPVDAPILHADESLLVVDKPAGVLSVPGRGEAGRINLLSHLRLRWPDAQVVHRLDMATSGLMLFARGAAAQAALSAAFRERRVAKAYEAIVHGLLAPEHGEIDLPLAADWPNRPRQQVDRMRGRPSLTRWRVLQRDPAAQRTRLALEPVTGRSHQLRVHLQAIGHPIVGDALYGPVAGCGVAGPRLLLHATRLQLSHPATGALMAFVGPAPFSLQPHPGWISA